jgi:SAM-dependent methyltransferase
MYTDGTFDREQHDYWAVRTNIRPYDHPVVQIFAEQRVGFIRQLLSDWRPSAALEVGCGDGFGLDRMKALVASIHGCDNSAAMLAANPMPKDCLTKANAYDLPFADGSFELVYCWELLHHVGDPPAAVNEMKRVASRCVLLCEPNSWNPAMAAYGLLKTEERGLLRFTPRYTRSLLVNAGLRDVRAATVGCFTPNLTPQWMANLSRFLPFRWPLVGMYNVVIGYI